MQQGKKVVLADLERETLTETELKRKKGTFIFSNECPLACRGEPRCTFVNEIIGLPLALTVFPQVYDFPGEAVLELVEAGLYRKAWSDHLEP